MSLMAYTQCAANGVAHGVAHEVVEAKRCPEAGNALEDTEMEAN